MRCPPTPASADRQIGVPVHGRCSGAQSDGTRAVTGAFIGAAARAVTGDAIERARDRQIGIR
jgi:hypothetical protein